MSTHTAPDVGPSPTHTRRADPSFPAHPYETNAEEMISDGLESPTDDVPTSTDDPFRPMADRIRAAGIAEPRHN